MNRQTRTYIAIVGYIVGTVIVLVSAFIIAAAILGVNA